MEQEKNVQDFLDIFSFSRSNKSKIRSIICSASFRLQAARSWTTGTLRIFCIMLLVTLSMMAYSFGSVFLRYLSSYSFLISSSAFLSLLIVGEAIDSFFQS